MLMTLATRSLWHRRWPVLLIILSLCLALTAALSVERIKTLAKTGFEQSLSGVDLIVGAPGGDVQTLLYTVFHLGEPTQNLSLQPLTELIEQLPVDWWTPIALGDSHRGYRVIATQANFFEHVQSAGKRPIELATGRIFSAPPEVVLGHQVAASLGYSLGDQIVLQHGTAELGRQHDDLPFEVVGILAPTGTPNDQAVFTSLEGFGLIHAGWIGGKTQFSARDILASIQSTDQLRPKTVTAAYIGLKSRLDVFTVQRAIEDDTGQPLYAVLPAVALAKLWNLVGLTDRLFTVISGVLMSIALLSLITMSLSNIDSRRREMSLLRLVGAPPSTILLLLALEAVLISLASGIIALALVTGVEWAAGRWLSDAIGISTTLRWPNLLEWFVLGGAILASVLSIGPAAIQLYQTSARAGLTR